MFWEMYTCMYIYLYVQMYVFPMIIKIQNSSITLLPPDQCFFVVKPHPWHLLSILSPHCKIVIYMQSFSARSLLSLVSFSNLSYAFEIHPVFVNVEFVPFIAK